MVEIHVRRRKRDGGVVVFDVAAVLTGQQTMMRNWRRGSDECMDKEAIRETLAYFHRRGRHYGAVVKVVPEQAIIDAEAGQVVNVVNTRYPCLIVETGEEPDPDPGAYVRQVQSDIRRLAQTATLA